jgi:hypothetical protein
MVLGLHDLILGIAMQAVGAIDAAMSSLWALYAAGASGGLDPGPLVGGAAAGGALGAAGAAGGGRAGGGTGSDVPRGPDPGTVNEHRLGRSRFTDSSGNGYWPGISPIPGDGHVNWTEPRHPNSGGDRTVRLPVNPVTGRPTFPPQPRSAFEGTAALTSGGRG